MKRGWEGQTVLLCSPSYTLRTHALLWVAPPFRTTLRGDPDLCPHRSVSMGVLVGGLEWLVDPQGRCTNIPPPAFRVLLQDWDSAHMDTAPLLLDHMKPWKEATVAAPLGLPHSPLCMPRAHMFCWVAPPFRAMLRGDPDP